MNLSQPPLQETDVRVTIIVEDGGRMSLAHSDTRTAYEVSDVLGAYLRARDSVLESISSDIARLYPEGV